RQRPGVDLAQAGLERGRMDAGRRRALLQRPATHHRQSPTAARRRAHRVHQRRASALGAARPVGAQALPVTAPRIALVTPTCDRPQAFALCERWMARQTVPWTQWIVADGGATPQPVTLGQTVIRRPSPPGIANFAGNVLAALEVVRAD